MPQMHLVNIKRDNAPERALHLTEEEETEELALPLQCFQHNSAHLFGKSTESVGPKSYLRTSLGDP